MKDFLKSVLATVTGIIIASGILFVFGMGIIASIASMGETETTVDDNTVFCLNLDGPITDRATDNPLSLLGSDDIEETYGLDNITDAIKKAAKEEKIKGIYLTIGNMAATPATLEEIRDALEEFKATGKFIISYADNYSQGGYYLASVSDEVFLNPQGTITWTGMSSQFVSYKRLLDKVGVKMQIFKVGTYKSAVEPFTTEKMSDANREQVKAFTSSIWETFINDISKSRDMTPETLNACADRGIMFEKAESFVDCGFVDSLAYRTDMTGYLKTKVGIDADDDLNTLSLAGVTGINANVPKDKSGNIVAVYYADGDIDDTKGKDRIGALRVISDLEALQNDKDVKAVVLRVNSPGGSAFGSEQIWKQVRDLKAEKPVVVSMGGYAASGGYYISCNADYIYAQPTTLTGSIGIFGMVPDGSGLLDKIGISSETVSTNKFGGMMSFDRAMTEEEKALMQRSVNNGYDLFVARCADGRKMLPDDIKKVAEGRVWTGAMAKQLGLVDDLGGLDEAIAKAKELAEVEDCTIITYPAKPSMLDEILSSLPKGYVKTFTPDGAAQVIDGLRWLTELDNINPLQARMPYWVEIN